MQQVITDNEVNWLVEHGIRTFLSVQCEKLFMGYFDCGSRELAWQAVEQDDGWYVVRIAKTSMDLELGWLMNERSGRLNSERLSTKVQEQIEAFRGVFSLFHGDSIAALEDCSGVNPRLDLEDVCDPIRYARESDRTPAESLRQALLDAKEGRILPLSQMWDGIEEES